jgi:uncharacterized protein
VNTPQSGYVANRVLKLQVGFLLNEGAGQSRDFEFDVPRIMVSDDLTLDYLRGKLHLSRTSRGILVQGTLHTELEAECNRCLEPIHVALEMPVEELFVYPPEPGDDYVLFDDGILDLAPIVRQEVVLNTPIGALCRENCAGLCPECGANLNDGACGCEDAHIDPRLAALKELKNRMSDQT